MQVLKPKEIIEEIYRHLKQGKNTRTMKNGKLKVIPEEEIRKDVRSNNA